MTKLDLLGKDYYSKESSKRYWSISQYKRFRECEARALAELRGDWTDTRNNTALLVGNYVHSYFESEEAHEEFKAQNGFEMISSRGATKGQLKKDYLVAEQMIKALKSDGNFSAIYQGEKEVAITGFLGEVEFKGKIDCLNVERGYFVDIKTTKGPIDDKVWNGEERVFWFEAYGYILQVAAYKTMLEAKYNKPFEPIIYAVTKETPSDTRAIRIQNVDAMQNELDNLAQNIKRLDDVKKGIKKPKPCGKCEYCRANQLTQRVMIF
ncbi:TPA: PD-(D/E)XK nuclease-like domain-containing protein [Streptococcus agalactiae]|uniref:PD-(D/E)XK nuclease-like domain-containing protein n=1 Tax=Streptococcus agalactiae TaxID=1311 RepID=UPI00035E219E|nr:PD-(D/E)XK nuclease-like domain-containing protein [Streptococcus agalactiae]HEN0199820.1 PD-(D/E)XK nuclease-like domain-containing protein [Streptococcus agalactiae]HEN0218878.1 PD-(D/E)XK nuclease-like domain-containing protein [Streptococcus agalactiae]HEN0239789.1 PD-(D/E)XK nuclease-like domain-containing protein [Streptococcus agalactiae]HEN0253955.1 PD-(D/E)XK nuclease-like domain-containing protein [Streptococcus agalactiae]HEN0341963.1 PD-(D/E)XK nuclease-like domain-containing pr